MTQVRALGLYRYLHQRPAGLDPERVFLRRYKKGAFIYQPPSRLTNMFEVVEGAVKLGCYKNNEVEVTYEVLEAGDFFGNLQFLNGQFSEFSKTLVPTTIRCYEISFFRDIITKDPQVAEWFFAKLTGRWCRSETRLVHINTLEPRQRIRMAEQLLRKPVRDAEGKESLLCAHLTHKDLADLTGTTRQLVAEVRKATAGISNSTDTYSITTVPLQHGG